MNPMVRRTWVLLACVLGLGAVQVYDVFAPEAALAELPGIEPIERSKAQRLRVSSALAEVVMERTGPESWSIVTPFAFPADGSRVRSVFSALRTGVVPEVQVDRGNFEDYGLNDDKAILVEITGEDGLDVSFHLGLDASGGSSFIRYPDDDAVYLADVGGRVRYDRAAIAWRDHMVTQFSPELINGVRIERVGDSTWDLTRETGVGEAPSDWKLSSDPELDVDQVWVTELAERLATIRSGQIVGPEHPAAQAPVVAMVTLSLVTQETIPLEVRAFDGGSWVKRADREVLYKVADGFVGTVTRPDAALESRQFFEVPLGFMEFLAYHSPSQQVVLRRDPNTKLWSAVQPRGMAVDLREVIFTARTLGQLRVFEMADVTPAAAGFPSDERLVITLTNKGQAALELGGKVPDAPKGFPARYVRRADQPERIGFVLEEDLSRMERAFGR